MVWEGGGHGAWVWSIRTPHRGHQQNPTSINITTVSDCSCLYARLADTAVLLCCVCCCCCSCLVLRVCGWRGARPSCFRQHSNGTAAAAVVVYLYVRLHAAFLAVSQCTLQGCLQQQAGFRICLSDANMLWCVGMQQWIVCSYSVYCNCHVAAAQNVGSRGLSQQVHVSLAVCNWVWVHSCQHS